ncbi:MAG: hypothetical protein ABIN44_09445, partial [Burkholderiaceae bacterium]
MGAEGATPEQTEFIDLVVRVPMQAGCMESDRLFQSPRTDLHAQGPRGFRSAKGTASVLIPAEM